MAAGTLLKLTSEQVKALDPYAFLAVLGKRVIHPGGRASTDKLISWAGTQPAEEVLDIGCGVATTALRLAGDHRTHVVAADLSPLMRERAARGVAAAGLAGRVEVAEADILEMPYPDDRFDCVIAEAVTMFVDRPRAAAELVRVCRPGGRVLATEFYWRRPPTPEAKEVFLGQVCPGLRFDGVEEWVDIYGDAGLTELRTHTGPFEMMTPRGFLADEGRGALAVMARTMSRPAYLRKMAWLMPRMGRAVPYLGYILVAGRKPSTA